MNGKRGMLDEKLFRWLPLALVILGCSPTRGQLAPTNDLFLNRIALGLGLESHLSTNTFATAEPPDEPAHRGLSAVRSVWWRWTAPQSDGYVLVTSTNSPS